MNGKSNGINWLRQNVINSLKSTVHMIIDTQPPQDDQILMNGDAVDADAAEDYLIANEAEGNLDQIAAENLIFMARDGQMVTEIIETRTDENGTVVVSASDGTPIDYESVLGQAALQQVVAMTSNNVHAGTGYVEQYDDDTPQMVTEEVITDDWVQYQGEERVEISAEQIVGSSTQVVQEIEVPLPTVQDEYTALRPYPCDFCSRRFRKKTSLMNHMLSSHQNDKPHLCKLCGSRFFRRSDLINHLKAHAENDPTDGIPFSHEPDQQHEINARVTSDHYYDHDWHTDMMNDDDEFHTKAKRLNALSGNSSSATSSVNVPNVVRGRISRLKLKDYVGHDTKVEEMPSNGDMDYIDCQQLQASTAAVKLSNDQSPDNQKHYPIINDCKPFVCQQCGLAFAREKALLSHSKTHHMETQLECNQCNDVFWDEQSLQEHQKTHQFEDSNSEFDPEEAEETQSESDNGQVYAEYYCSECGISFHRQDLLRRHERTHLKTNAVMASTSTDSAKDGQHCCNTCGETFAEALDLLAHAEIHARYPPFKCLLCGESFFEEYTIQRHLQSQHANELTPNSCILCGKECRDRKALMKHAWDHSREKCHSCSKCGKNFHNKARLKRHMASHRDKSVTCEVCHEEFPDGRSLSNHRHSHSANSAGKLFPCNECGKTFGSRSSQQIHVRIHTGERPYGCRFCWKAFADGGTLRKHERIHTGEKPYACSVCPRAFNQRVVLREHIRSHHSGLDPKRGVYYCTVCTAQLPNSNDLIQHLIEHSDKNTAMHRAPVTGPRKYKRRRKLKPHEIAHMRNECKQNGNAIDIDISDIDMDNVDDLLGITENATTSTNTTVMSRGKGTRKYGASKGKTGKTKSADYDDDDEAGEDSNAGTDEDESELIDVTNVDSQYKKRNSSNHSSTLINDNENARQSRAKHTECTAQRTHEVQYIKIDQTAARTSAAKTRKKSDKLMKQTRPRMIHTEKVREAPTNSSTRRRSTRSAAATANIELLAATRSITNSSTIVDDYEIISPATQPPKQISSSPLHIKQEQHDTTLTQHNYYQQHTAVPVQLIQSIPQQQQKLTHGSPVTSSGPRNSDLYDAQLLLEASTLRKNIYEKFNPSIVNDLEEILGSPIKTDKSERERFTSESSTTQFLAEQSEEEQNMIKIEPTSPDLREIVAGGSVVDVSNNNAHATTSTRQLSRRKYLEFETSTACDSIINNNNNNNNNVVASSTNSSPTKTSTLHSMPKRSTANSFIMKSASTLRTISMPKSPITTMSKATNSANYHTSFNDDAFSTGSSVDASSYFSISAVVSAADATVAAAEAAAAAAASSTTKERRQRMFECEMCSAVFSDRAQLLDHVHIHI